MKLLRSLTARGGGGVKALAKASVNYESVFCDSVLIHENFLLSLLPKEHFVSFDPIRIDARKRVTL